MGLPLHKLEVALQLLKSTIPVGKELVAVYLSNASVVTMGETVGPDLIRNVQYIPAM